MPALRGQKRTNGDVLLELLQAPPDSFSLHTQCALLTDAAVQGVMLCVMRWPHYFAASSACVPVTARVEAWS